MRRGRRPPRGQIVITLLGAYVVFLVLMALVLNSAMLTSEKIKLQNTADIGAFAAAEVQRLKLNRIRQANQEILKAWAATQAQLLLPSPCYFGLTCASSLNCRICPALEAARTGLIIQNYLSLWQKYRYLMFGPEEQEGGDLNRPPPGDIINANMQAGIAALENSLLEKNLPPLLAEQIKKVYGGSYPDLETLVKQYADATERGPDLGLGDLNRDGQSDALKDAYEPILSWANLPWGKWQVEVKKTQGFLYIWNLTWDVCDKIESGVITAMAAAFTPCSIATIPVPTALLSEIIKGWSLAGLPTRFYTDREFQPLYVHGAIYRPLLSFDFLMPQIDAGARLDSWLPPRNPFAAWVSAHQRRGYLRRGLVALAAAAPYGGRPPGPDEGDTGEIYQGSRLVGINDQQRVAKQLQLISRYLDHKITVDQLQQMLFLKSPEGSDPAYGNFDIQDFLH